MSHPLPARSDITVEVNSRCFCCLRMPKDQATPTPPNTPRIDYITPSLSERLSNIFSRSNKSEKTEGRPRTYSTTEIS